MLKKVKRLAYEKDYAYAPLCEDAVINTADIQSVYPTETRRTEPCVLVRFRNGCQMVCLGRPEDFVEEDP